MNKDLMQLLKKKKRLIIAVVVIIFVIITIIIFSSNATPQKPESIPQIQPIVDILPTKSAQEIQAISDQVKEDEKFADWERGKIAQYPWINRIPVRTDSYFVYFDLDQSRFIGLLYPKDGEDVEKIKADVMRELKEVKGIPADSFPFKWTVFPE